MRWIVGHLAFVGGLWTFSLTQRLLQEISQGKSMTKGAGGSRKQKSVHIHMDILNN